MDRPRIRPTFALPLSGGADEVIQVMRDRLQEGAYEDCTNSKGRCADFFVPEKERRLWSPYLSVQIENRAGGSLLRGRFGPHPEVWTLFMFLYAIVGFGTIMGLLLGFVQWQSGMDPWGFWGAYVGIPGLGLLYAISAVGQKLSAHQMESLRVRLEGLAAGLEAGGGAGDERSVGETSPSPQSPST